MSDDGPLCLGCADLDHLVYLPRGEAALTRRAKKASKLSAVVVRFSRTRKRYERQGILVEETALEAAEAECLADEEVRRRRRERDAERREREDAKFLDDFMGAIRQRFPGCPADRAEAIARHAGAKYSGRVGRSSGGLALDPEAIRLAVAASVRHVDTDYEVFLMAGLDRDEARARVADATEEVLDSWRHPRS